MFALYKVELPCDFGTDRRDRGIDVSQMRKREQRLHQRSKDGDYPLVLDCGNERKGKHILER